MASSPAAIAKTKKPDVVLSESIQVRIAVKFPRGQEVVAFAKAGDSGAEVEPQPLRRLLSDEARAWSTYYEVVADTIERLNGDPVP